MKKNYLTPSMSFEPIALAEIIAQSGGVRAQELDITYGGIDGDGKKDPSVKERSEWEDGLW